MQDVWIRVSFGDGLLPRSGPAEGLKDIGFGAGQGEGQAGAVAFVVEAGQHPGAVGVTEGQAIAERATAVVHEGQFANVHGNAGHGVQRIHDLLGGQAATFWRIEKAFFVGGAKVVSGRRALIGPGRQDEAEHVSHIVVVGDQFMGQPVEELRMAGLAAFPIMGGLDEARADESPPDAIDAHPGETLILRRGDQCRETFA